MTSHGTWPQLRGLACLAEKKVWRNVGEPFGKNGGGDDVWYYSRKQKETYSALEQSIWQPTLIYPCLCLTFPPQIQYNNYKLMRPLVLSYMAVRLQLYSLSVTWLQEVSQFVSKHWTSYSIRNWLQQDFWAIQRKHHNFSLTRRTAWDLGYSQWWIIICDTT